MSRGKLFGKTAVKRLCLLFFDLVREQNSEPSLRYLWILFLIVFFGRSPFEFAYPIDSLDPSWMWALSFFSQENLIFGQDVIYNFGPLADLHTKFYNPNTAGLFASINVGISLLLAKMLFDVTKERARLDKFIVCFLVGFCLMARNPKDFLETFCLVSDIFFEMYCIVFTLWVFCRLDSSDSPAKRLKLAELSLFSVPMMLMVLVKGNLIFVVVICAFVSFLWMLHRKNYLLAGSFGFVLPLGVLVVWVLLCQPLEAFLDYVMNIVRMSMAYLDGMALDGSRKHICVYLLFCALVPTLIFRKERNLQALLFVFCVAAFLFLGSKHGFGRHDWHARIASGTVMLVVLAYFLYCKPVWKKCFIWGAVVAFVAITIIGYSSPRKVLKRPQSPFVALVDFVLHKESLDKKYEELVASYRSRYRVGQIKGTVDIYNFNNSVALASTGKYTPRPIFQSYQAFDGYFAKKNLAHLKNSAPDNILFRVETIDGRYPTLDDGLSWPSIFKNYRLKEEQEGYLFLQRKIGSFEQQTLNPICATTTRFSKEIKVPSEGIVFAQIHFKKTILGRLISLALKTTNVYVNVNLKNGTTKVFRVIPRMAGTGFYLSPLIQNNEDVRQLFVDTLDASNIVKAIEFKTYLPGMFWSDEIQVEFLEHKPFVRNHDCHQTNRLHEVGTP